MNFLPFKLIAYRLYLSAQVVVTVIAAAAVLWWGTAELHDRYVAAADFKCLDQWQAGSGAILGTQPTEAEMVADLATAHELRDAQLVQRIEERIKVLRGSNSSGWTIVDVPDVGNVSFPSSMSKKQMEGHLNEFERYGWCHLKTSADKQPYSTRAWHIDAAERTRSYHQQELVMLAAAVIAPFALFGLYRWVRWIAKTPPAAST